MGHRFAQHKEAEVPASPDEVWAAIATGPGIDSWFMGRNEVEAGAGGAVRTVFGEYAPELEITEWDPARRFAYGSGQAPDGRFIAYEFLIAAHHLFAAGAEPGQARQAWEAWLSRTLA